MKATVGVIGGTGLYNMPGLTDLERVSLDTPFGAPSDEFVLGTLDGVRLAFLPRHGAGHRFTPSEINYRANVHGMKQLGVQTLLAVSAVGSLQQELPPGTVVLVDQFIDRTKCRHDTFFGDGLVGHVAFGEPICGVVTNALVRGATDAGVEVVRGGTYVCMEGPAFSTKAESQLYRSWGAQVIGMTNLTEAKLAREAGLCFATIALVTDYDCWHEDEEAVSVEMVMRTLRRNAEKAQRLVRHCLAHLPADGAELCNCRRAAEGAVLGSNRVSVQVFERFRVLCGEYLELREE